MVEILLVEDDPNDVRLALRAFAKSDLADRVHVVRDGEEALDFLFGEGAYASDHACVRPKVVLLDLKLPKVDGFEVLRRVRSDPRSRTVPVVVFTSSGEERDIAASYELGANSYLVKPFDFDELMRSLRDLGRYWVSLNRPPAG